MRMGRKNEVVVTSCRHLAVAVVLIGLFLQKEGRRTAKKMGSLSVEKATLFGWTNQMLHAVQMRARKRNARQRREREGERIKENVVTIIKQRLKSDQR